MYFPEHSCCMVRCELYLLQADWIVFVDNTKRGSTVIHIHTIPKSRNFYIRPTKSKKSICKLIKTKLWQADDVIWRQLYIYIYICWFDFDALAQGNAYIPTKEPINYHGPGGDRTHGLQTEATPSAARCPARSLQATEVVSKNTILLTCPGMHWTYIYIIYTYIFTWIFYNF